MTKTNCSPVKNKCILHKNDCTLEKALTFPDIRCIIVYVYKRRTDVSVKRTFDYKIIGKVLDKSRFMCYDKSTDRGAGLMSPAG